MESASSICAFSFSIRSLRLLVSRIFPVFTVSYPTVNEFQRKLFTIARRKDFPAWICLPDHLFLGWTGAHSRFRLHIACGTHRAAAGAKPRPVAAACARAGESGIISPAI